MQCCIDLFTRGRNQLTLAILHFVHLNCVPTWKLCLTACARTTKLCYHNNRGTLWFIELTVHSNSYNDNVRLLSRLHNACVCVMYYNAQPVIIFNLLIYGLEKIVRTHASAGLSFCTRRDSAHGCLLQLKRRSCNFE